MAATDRGVCFVQFGNSEQELVKELEKEFPRSEISPISKSELPELDKWIEALQSHLSGDIQTFKNLPLDVAGTAFQAKVWKYLQTIPSGEIRSYSQVAEGIGSPKAVRAVASACASNRIAVLIPCHRVLRGTGELSGYRWGVERKRSLLEVEKSQAAS